MSELTGRIAEAWSDKARIAAAEARKRKHGGASCEVGRGNCYESAFNRLFESGKHHVLVHGTATGQGPIKGVAFGHAWVERREPGKDPVVIDKANGLDVEMPASAYYALGKIRDTHAYTPDEAIEAARKTMHYGPWDEDSWKVA